MDDLKLLREKLDMLLAGRMSPDERDAFFTELERVQRLTAVCLRQLIDEQSLQPGWAISGAFIWSESPQGIDYWYAIERRFADGPMSDKPAPDPRIAEYVARLECGYADIHATHILRALWREHGEDTITALLRSYFDACYEWAKQEAARQQ